MSVGVAVAASLTASCTSGVPHCAPPPPPPPAIPVSYALVEYRAGVESRAPKVEVNNTIPTYVANRTTYKKVAIRFPDSCLTTAASNVTGVAVGSAQSILSTNCGVYLSEIEKLLTNKGYIVFSWDALRGLERQKNLAPYAAGKELGADIVFVFNSLDAAEIESGTVSGASYKYFSSNEKGDRGEPLALDDATRGTFKEFAKAQAGSDDAKAVVALSSTLDSAAISTGTGESVWFYRRTVTEAVSNRRGMRFLFGRVEGQPWTPAAPALPAIAAIPIVKQPVLKTEDVTESQVAGKADVYAQEKLKLIQDAARDFVLKFQNGQGS
jgi:hypothetical protein